MKLNRILALTGTIALFGAVACTEPIEDNPTYDKDAQEVTAQFVLSVATRHGAPASRMTETDVQYNGNFRGMDEVHLLTYGLDFLPAGDDCPHIFMSEENGNGWAESAKATRDFDLGTIMTEDEVSASQSSKVLQISLPLGTNTVLLYGRAPKTKTSDEQGSVTAAGVALSSTMSNVSFKLDSRLADKAAWGQYTELMRYILTGLINAGRYNSQAGSGFDTQTRINEYAFWWPLDETSKEWATVDDEGNAIPDGNTTYHAGYRMYRGEKVWREYGLAYKANNDDTKENDVQMGTLEELMGEFYTNITTIQTKGTKTELRAGASVAILRLASDLYEAMTKIINSSASSPEDHIAQLVAEEIISRATGFFMSDGSGLVWRDITALKSTVATFLPDHDWDTDFYLVTDAFFYNEAKGRPGFPMNLGMPSGSALISFMSVPPQAPVAQQREVCYYLEDIPSYGMGSASSTFSIDNYRYPAELFYWTNSSIRTNNNSVEASGYPVTTTTWDQDDWGSDWAKHGTVKSTTRAVAVSKEVNYGTALLKTTFKYGAETIYDNNSGVHGNAGETDNAVDVANKANQFKVTGLIIGGMDDEVGWNFLSRNNQFTKFVYDRFTASRQINIPAYGTTSSPNFTLLWDNYNSSLDGSQSKVYIAVELVNQTGKDIWGELNLIRAGGTFYLVGEIDPNTASAIARLPKKNGVLDLSRSNFNYPPYDQYGKTISVVRAFMQDYVTEVNFTFGPHSLKNAYVTMPDLRASNVSLGLSVDLVWSEGPLFDDVLMGHMTN